MKPLHSRVPELQTFTAGLRSVLHNGNSSNSQGEPEPQRRPGR
jgi:hypothetical protein